VWSDGYCTIDFDVIIQSAFMTNRRELQHVLARDLLDKNAIENYTSTMLYVLLKFDLLKRRMEFNHTIGVRGAAQTIYQRELSICL
jgi:hypothetical protein